ncbi:unnamed protein product [Amoebophrya sp. A120]|nr:unnamed protein product [Amoebophrya sp. A120]|eukprot:GSA120T00014997001.1
MDLFVNKMLADFRQVKQKMVDKPLEDLKKTEENMKQKILEALFEDSPSRTSSSSSSSRQGREGGTAGGQHYYNASVGGTSHEQDRGASRFPGPHLRGPGTTQGESHMKHDASSLPPGFASEDSSDNERSSFAALSRLGPEGAKANLLKNRFGVLRVKLKDGATVQGLQFSELVSDVSLWHEETELVSVRIHGGHEASNSTKPVRQADPDLEAWLLLPQNLNLFTTDIVFKLYDGVCKRWRAGFEEAAVIGYCVIPLSELFSDYELLDTTSTSSSTSSSATSSGAADRELASEDQNEEIKRDGSEGLVQHRQHFPPVESDMFSGEKEPASSVVEKAKPKLVSSSGAASARVKMDARGNALPPLRWRDFLTGLEPPQELIERSAARPVSTGVEAVVAASSARKGFHFFLDDEVEFPERQSTTGSPGRAVSGADQSLTSLVPTAAVERPTSVAAETTIRKILKWLCSPAFLEKFGRQLRLFRRVLLYCKLWAWYFFCVYCYARGCYYARKLYSFRESVVYQKTRHIVQHTFFRRDFFVEDKIFRILPASLLKIEDARFPSKLVPVREQDLSRDARKKLRAVVSSRAEREMPQGSRRGGPPGAPAIGPGNEGGTTIDGRSGRRSPRVMTGRRAAKMDDPPEGEVEQRSATGAVVQPADYESSSGGNKMNAPRMKPANFLETLFGRSAAKPAAEPAVTTVLGHLVVDFTVSLRCSPLQIATTGKMYMQQGSDVLDAVEAVAELVAPKLLHKNSSTKASDAPALISPEAVFTAGAEVHPDGGTKMRGFFPSGTSANNDDSLMAQPVLTTDPAAREAQERDHLANLGGREGVNDKEADDKNKFLVEVDVESEESRALLSSSKVGGSKIESASLSSAVVPKGEPIKKNYAGEQRDEDQKRRQNSTSAREVDHGKKASCEDVDEDSIQEELHHSERLLDLQSTKALYEHAHFHTVGENLQDLASKPSALQLSREISNTALDQFRDQVWPDSVGSKSSLAGYELEEVDEDSNISAPLPGQQELPGPLSPRSTTPDGVEDGPRKILNKNLLENLKLTTNEFFKGAGEMLKQKLAQNAGSQRLVAQEEVATEEVGEGSEEAPNYPQPDGEDRWTDDKTPAEDAKKKKQFKLRTTVDQEREMNQGAVRDRTPSAHGLATLRFPSTQVVIAQSSSSNLQHSLDESHSFLGLRAVESVERQFSTSGSHTTEDLVTRREHDVRRESLQVLQRSQSREDDIAALRLPAGTSTTFRDCRQMSQPFGTNKGGASSLVAGEEEFLYPAGNNYIFSGHSLSKTSELLESSRGPSPKQGARTDDETGPRQEAVQAQAASACQPSRRGLLHGVDTTRLGGVFADPDGDTVGEVDGARNRVLCRRGEEATFRIHQDLLLNLLKVASNERSTQSQRNQFITSSNYVGSTETTSGCAGRAEVVHNEHSNSFFDGLRRRIKNSSTREGKKKENEAAAKSRSETAGTSNRKNATAKAISTEQKTSFGSEDPTGGASQSQAVEETSSLVTSALDQHLPALVRSLFPPAKIASATEQQQLFFQSPLEQPVVMSPTVEVAVGPKGKGPRTSPRTAGTTTLKHVPSITGDEQRLLAFGDHLQKLRFEYRVFLPQWTAFLKLHEAATGAAGASAGTTQHSREKPPRQKNVLDRQKYDIEASGKRIVVGFERIGQVVADWPSLPQSSFGNLVGAYVTFAFPSWSFPLVFLAACLREGYKNGRQQRAKVYLHEQELVARVVADLEQEQQELELQEYSADGDIESSAAGAGCIGRERQQRTKVRRRPGSLNKAGPPKAATSKVQQLAAADEETSSIFVKMREIVFGLHKFSQNVENIASFMEKTRYWMFFDDKLISLILFSGLSCGMIFLAVVLYCNQFEHLLRLGFGFIFVKRAYFDDEMPPIFYFIPDNKEQEHRRLYRKYC